MYFNPLSNYTYFERPYFERLPIVHFILHACVIVQTETECFASNHIAAVCRCFGFHFFLAAICLVLKKVDLFSIVVLTSQ